MYFITKLTFDQLCVECLFKGGGGDMKSIPSLSKEGGKKEAYPTNVVDLWVVACKPIILAGNQSCSQCYELVKCVTCQGSLRGFFFLGLVNKGYILRTRASVALTKEEPNAQRLSFIVEVPLFSFFFLFFSPQRKLDESRSGDLGNQAFPVFDLSVGDTVFLGFRWFIHLWIDSKSIYLLMCDTAIWYGDILRSEFI